MRSERVASAAAGDGLLRAVALCIWIVPLLFAGILLLILTIIPNMTPANGVLNAGGRPVGLDFIALYSAGTLLREGRAAAAYDDQAIAAAESANAGAEITNLRWPYPPGNLPLAGALASLPYLPALAVWLGLALLGLGIAVWKITDRLVMALLLPVFPAVSYDAMTGQTGIAAAALAGGGFWLLPRNPALAGILFGCLTLKPQLALLLPFCLLAARQWKALAYFLATAVALQLLGLAVGGVDTAAAFLASAAGQMDRVAATPALVDRVPTVFIGLISAGVSPSAAMAGQALATVATVAVVCLVWRQSQTPLWRSLGWAAGLPLSVPYVFDYDLAVLTIPIACFAAAAAPRIGGFEALAITLLWSMAVLVSPIAAAIGLQLGCLPAAALLAYAAWGACRAPAASAARGSATRQAFARTASSWPKSP